LSNLAQLLSVDDYPQRLRQWKPVKAREEVEGLAYQTARLIQEGQLNKPDAVDRLREIALGSGVYDDLGDDAECFIQADLTAGFAAFELDRDRTCGGMLVLAPEERALPKSANARWKMVCGLW
jgi:hypothetical protein